MSGARPAGNFNCSQSRRQQALCADLSLPKRRQENQRCALYRLPHNGDDCWSTARRVITVDSIGGSSSNGEEAAIISVTGGQAPFL